MYNLTLHIEYLLLRHDCVVVPGVGAFINERKAARHDSVSGEWLPMSREVRFNSSLSHDDGLLAHSYARKERVGFEEGRELMRRAVCRLQEALQTDGEVTLGNLGILARNGGATVFTPQFRDGMSARILGYGAAPLVKRKPEAKPKATETVVEEERITLPRENGGRNFNTERNYYIAINKMFAKIAACVAAVLIVALSVSLPAGDNARIDKASVVPVDRLTEQAAPGAPAAETVVTPAEVAPVEVAPDATEAAPRFHAIVATFNNVDEAETFVKQYMGKGYDLSVVSTRTRSRVSAYSSASRQELTEKIGTPEFRKEFPEAWIWESTR